MNKKDIKVIASAMKMDTVARNLTTLQQAGSDETMNGDKRELKRKIAKQTDVGEKKQSDKSVDKMKLIRENLFLLSEIGKLKKSNESMSQRIYYLETIVKVPLKDS